LFKLKKITEDLRDCWNQVGAEDHFISQQAERIDGLEKRCEALDNQLGQQSVGDQPAEASNELSMTHDYVSGLHYSLVGRGGFLRNGLSLS